MEDIFYFYERERTDIYVYSQQECENTIRRKQQSHRTNPAK